MHSEWGYCLSDVFKQPKLTETLKNVAASGADYMDTGQWAKRFVKIVRDADGKITMNDMRRYKI
jgi:gamma-glutamyltranspeptidase/glutathione hydrolase